VLARKIIAIALFYNPLHRGLMISHTHHALSAAKQPEFQQKTIVILNAVCKYPVCCKLW
jgi:hypothetical protein